MKTKISIIIILGILFLFNSFVHANSFNQLSDTQMLALTIYGEARGEPLKGKIAVGLVILEREKMKQWGSSIKSVVLYPYQFSCFLPSDVNHNKLKRIANNWKASFQKNKTLQEVYYIADGVINGKLTNFSFSTNIYRNQPTHFKTKSVNPNWSKSMVMVEEIGNHQFFAKKEVEQKINKNKTTMFVIGFIHDVGVFLPREYKFSFKKKDIVKEKKNKILAV